jgi:hypothetical protein
MNYEICKNFEANYVARKLLINLILIQFWHSDVYTEIWAFEFACRYSRKTRLLLVMQQYFLPVLHTGYCAQRSSNLTHWLMWSSNTRSASNKGCYHTVGRMALEVVGLMGRRGQANMPPRSLLPRPQGVGKKNQSSFFIAAARISTFFHALVFSRGRREGGSQSHLEFQRLHTSPDLHKL